MAVYLCINKPFFGTFEKLKPGDVVVTDQPVEIDHSCTSSPYYQWLEVHFHNQKHHIELGFLSRQHWNDVWFKRFA